MTDPRPVPDDLPDWSDTDLDQHSLALSQERQRRLTLATIPATIAELSAQYGRALGRTSGAPWSQPQGGHDAYPLGAVVTHDGHTWVSDIPANVWAPGQHGWTIDDDAATEPQPDAEPWAEGVAYAVGDLAEFEGTVYRVLQAHTSQAGWTPPAVQALWVAA